MHHAKLALTALLCGLPFAACQAGCGDLNTQLEMNQCAAQAQRQADQQLNEVYQVYRSRLDGAQRRQLQKVQGAWLRFRDLACAFEGAGYQGGSLQPFVVHTCLSELTQERWQQLRRLADGQGGDAGQGARP